MAFAFASRRTLLAAAFAAALVAPAAADPVRYDMDPKHTYPAFEADHAGGMSVWRGKLKIQSGHVVLDRAAKKGALEVVIDMASVDFLNDALADHVRGPEFFDVAQFPTATYKGTLAKFRGDLPTEVDGELTFHGVTRPVVLKIDMMKCQVSAMTQRETCGADATAAFKRSDFGVDWGQSLGFKMDVLLRISVEAIRAAS